MLEELVELGRAVSSGATQSRDAFERTLRLRSLAQRVRHPVAELARALHVRPEPDAWLTFRSFPRWPTDLNQAFRHLPPEFVEAPASLSAQAAFWTFHFVLSKRPRGIIELGSGTSTLLLGVAAERLSDPLERPRHLVVESDAERRDAVERALRATGRLASVELKSAVASTELEGIDFVFIGHRLTSALDDQSGFIAALRPGALLLLENGTDEPAAADWTRSALLRRTAFIAHRPGLVLLERVLP